jgi:hypothetical protein
MATNYFYGLNMRWSTNGVGSTAFGVQALIQSIDHEEQMAEFTAPNQLGNTAIWAGHDLKKTGTFEYVHANSAPPDGNSPVVKPTQGSKITIADTVDANSDMNGTNWIVQSVVERRMATDAVKVTVRAIAYPAIS